MIKEKLQNIKSSHQANLENQGSDNMKHGWEIKKLGEVCETAAGGTPLKTHKDYYEGGNIPWLLSGEVSQGEIFEAKNFITEKGLKNSSAKLFPPNTVLVAMYGATAGQVGILRFEAATNQAVCGILPNDKTIPEYLFYCFLSKKEELVAQAVGGAQPNISQIKIKNTKIPLPPLSEQQRIVSILDEAFAAIDKAKANAEQNLKNAKELFESYLQGVFEKKGDGWEVKCLDELGTITSSKRIYKSEYVKEGVPFYRTKEIKELSNGNPITLELFISRNRYEQIKKSFGVPQIGDLLMSAVGTIGEIMVIENEDEFYFKDGNIVWFKDFQRLDTKYLKYSLTALVENIKSLALGAAYSALTIEKLNKYEIAFPKTKEE